MPGRLSSGFIISCLLLAACSIGGGAGKDLATGLAYSYSKCSVREVKIIDDRGIPFTDNVVHQGATFQIAASGVQYFSITDGKAYPRCELTIKDKSGQTIAHIDDLLETSARDGISTPGTLDLSATIRLSPPLISGESYVITARFFDKQEAKREIVAEVKVLLED